MKSRRSLAPTSVRNTSIVVCAYQADESLVPTLRALQAQRSRRGTPQVVLVAQRPRPTFSAVKEAFPPSESVRVVEDSGIGLSRARNLGLRASDGDIVAFVDDSVTPEEGWLEAIETAFDEHGCDCVGGAIIPEWPAALPRWFSPPIEESVGGRTSLDREMMTFPKTPFGGNIAFRRGVFEKCGLFDTRLGRTGAALISGEEVELCFRIYAAGGTVFFEPSARVRHRVAASRLTKAFVRSRWYWQGRTTVRIYRIRGLRPPSAIKGVAVFGAFSILSVLRIFNPPKHFFAECVAATKLGEIVERLSGAPKVVPPTTGQGAGTRAG